METGECRDYQVRIRYRQPYHPARMFCRHKRMYIVFDKLQRGNFIGSGQVLRPWYDGDELMGSGVIDR